MDDARPPTNGVEELRPPQVADGSAVPSTVEVVDSARPMLYMNTFERFPRRWSLALLVPAVAVLGLATWLTPDARGFGTHQQLGFAPCGSLVLTGYPCPTCGMTTAFSLTMHGAWLRAMWVQPGGFVLCLTTAAVALICLYAFVAGRWPPRPRWLRMYYFFWGLLITILGGWGFRLVAGLATGEYPMRYA